MSRKQPATALLIILIAAAVLVAAGYALKHTVSSFLLSFVLAYLLDPLVVVMERKGLRRTLGIAILYTLLAVLSAFCVAFLVPFINIRWNELLAELPQHLQKGKEILLGMSGRFEPRYASEEWRWLLDQATGGVETVLSKLGDGLYAAVGRVAFNLLNLILAPILVFFMLYYKKEMSAGIVLWIPAGQRENFLALGREVNAGVGGYLRGQLIVSLIVAVLSTLALLLLDIDYPLLNGIFAGLASVLPFIGVILATLPPLFFAYVKFQNGIILVKVLAAFSAIYFIEGYLIKPIVFKKSMDLNPLVTIIVVMAFGELMGFWGILLAIPLAATFKIIIGQYRRGGFTPRD